MKNLLRLNKYFVRYKWHLLFGTLFVVGSNYFKVWIPQVVQEALDFVWVKLEEIKAEGGSLPTDELLFFSLKIVSLAMLMGLFLYFTRKTIIVMSRLIEYDLRKDIFSHYEKLDLSFFKSNKTGDIMSRVSEDVSKVRMYLGPAVLYGLNLTTTSALVIYSMLQVSHKLTLYTLLPLPFLSVSIYFVSRIINRRSRKIQTQLARLTSVSQEVYSGIRIVKSYVKENDFVSFFSDESEDFKKKSLSLAQVNAFFYPLMILLISASTLITIYVSGLELKAGNITVGNMAEFVLYVNMLTWPFAMIGWLASLIQEAEASQQRINEFMDQKPMVYNQEEMESNIEGGIIFDNVSFKYPETGIEALKEVSFKLAAGEKMAIIGKTASGKSTIAELLLRMYDVSEGEILIDQKNIKQVHMDNLRQEIGYVPQDVFLFSDTVENNIRFGNPKASSADVEQYARHAAVHEDIIKLPEGYETMVGERGVTLSGGQKQRISLARAFIKDSKIVILDDCLSAVDTNTERKILNYIQDATNNRTAIIITHRIYSLLEFDQIIVLDEGRIVETGTHSDLLARKGQYAELYEQQQMELV